jgi:hypothetical protein
LFEIFLSRRPIGARKYGTFNGREAHSFETLFSAPIELTWPSVSDQCNLVNQKTYSFLTIFTGKNHLAVCLFIVVKMMKEKHTRLGFFADRKAINYLTVCTIFQHFCCKIEAH